MAMNPTETQDPAPVEIMVQRDSSLETITFENGTITIRRGVFDKFLLTGNYNLSGIEPADQKFVFSLRVSGNFEHDGMIEDELREFDLTLPDDKRRQIGRALNHLRCFAEPRINAAHDDMVFRTDLLAGFAATIAFTAKPVAGVVFELQFSNDYGMTRLKQIGLENVHHLEVLMLSAT